MALGLIFCTAYFVLILLGFGRKDDETKVSKKSEEKLASSTKSSSDKSDGKQLQLADEKLEVTKRGKQRQGLKLKSDKQRPIQEGTLSCQIEAPDANKSYLQQAPADSEMLAVEQSSAPVKSEDLLCSQDALYLQEFNVSVDFITERERIRENKITTSQANDNFSECLNRNFEQGNDLNSSDVNRVELSHHVTQTSSSTVYSEPGVQRFEIPVSQNEQPVLLSEPCVDVAESNSSTDVKQDSLIGDFAEFLVARAKRDAYSDIDLDMKANIYAEKISAQIVSDAIGQFTADSDQQELRSAKVEEIHSFAGNVVDSLFQGATGKISLVKDVETFAKDMSEQVINESIEYYAAKEKLEQGRKKKVSLHEMWIFSEGIISEVLCDGIEEAAIAPDDSKEDFVRDQNLPTEEQTFKDSLPEGAGSLTNQVCQTSHQELTLSSTLQPHISGVVENLVNGAIYEAALRVKAQRGESGLEDSDLEGCAQEILESQVDETVKELIVSALNKAADHEGQESEAEPSHTNKTQIESHVESYVDDAMGEAVSEAVVKVTEQETVSNQEEGVMNGKIDLPSESVIEQSCQSTPEIVVLTENDTDMTDQDEGFDVVPSKEKDKLKEKKTGESDESGGYWRRSLILDLEGEEEFDESVESEKTPSSTKDEDLVSDEESEEFIDSSEDEIIDHAEDAKMGAVGGSSIQKYESDDDDKMDLEDELDDDDDDDNDNDMFVPQSMVDGLCVSKPKEKRKRKKHKTAPRARIQSG